MSESVYEIVEEFRRVERALERGFVCDKEFRLRLEEDTFVTIGVYQGKPLVHIRECNVNSRSGLFVPTRAGITISIEGLKDFFKRVDAHLDLNN